MSPRLIILGFLTIAASVLLALPAEPAQTTSDPDQFSSGEGGLAAAEPSDPPAAEALAIRQAHTMLTAEPRGSASAALRLGGSLLVGRALLASYVTGRLTDLPGLTAASARIAGATLGAVVVCGALDATVGRLRADREALGWGAGSFPSMHSAVAFSAAAALDAETSARWVPWVAYPAATAVGWLSASEGRAPVGDVLAGAALGFWTGRKVDEIERGSVHLLDRARFLLRGSRRNFRVGFQTRF